MKTSDYDKVQQLMRQREAIHAHASEANTVLSPPLMGALKIDASILMVAEAEELRRLIARVSHRRFSENAVKLAELGVEVTS